ncbi:MAG: tetratricopeptide repeat protein [Fimbriimonadaceae bacterium]|nr:tetratricopeptide repeat protein [Chitinophagales bacterium]
MKKISIIISALLLTLNVVVAQSSKVSSAISYYTSQEYDRALDAINAAILHEKTMNEAKTWYYRGQIFNAIASDPSGKFTMLVINPVDSALKSFKTALSMSDSKNYKEKIKLDLQFIQMSYFNNGATAYSAKDFEAAYKAFSNSAEANNLQLDIDPNLPIDTGAIFNIGLTAQKIGKTDEAISTYQRLVDMKYNEPYLYQALSDMYMEKGQPELAQKAINAGRAAFPKDEAILITELNFYLSQGRAGEIVDKLKEAIALDPNNPELYFALGNSYGELMKLDSVNSANYFNGAVSAYQNALNLKPESFEINLNAGALYYNAAIEINKRMINLPLDDEAGYMKLEKERNELYRTALPYFEKAHASNKDDVPTIQALREIYAKTGNYDKMNEMKTLLGE